MASEKVSLKGNYESNQSPSTQYWLIWMVMCLLSESAIKKIFFFFTMGHVWRKQKAQRAVVYKGSDIERRGIEPRSQLLGSIMRSTLISKKEDDKHMWRA